MIRRAIIIGIGATIPLPDAADKALVQLASPAEAAALTHGPVVLGQVPLGSLFPQNLASQIGSPVYVKVAADIFASIGILTNCQMTVHGLDATSWSGDIQYIPGPVDYHLGFEGP